MSLKNQPLGSSQPPSREEIAKAVAVAIMEMDWAQVRPQSYREGDADEKDRRDGMIQEAVMTALTPTTSRPTGDLARQGNRVAWHLMPYEDLAEIEDLRKAYDRLHVEIISDAKDDQVAKLKRFVMAAIRARTHIASFMDAVMLRAMSTPRPAGEGLAGQGEKALHQDDLMFATLHKGDLMFATLHKVAVAVGVIDEDVPCNGSQVIAAMEAYCDHIACADANDLAGQRQPVAWEKTPAAIEAMAEHLLEEDHEAGWVWPTHRDDDGYRGNGYVRIAPPDVQSHLRDKARRVLIRAAQIAAAPILDVADGPADTRARKIIREAAALI